MLTLFIFAPQATIEAMVTLGHVVEKYPYFFNVVNAVSKEGQCISAVSDARKVGKSAGY